MKKIIKIFVSIISIFVILIIIDLFSIFVFYKPLLAQHAKTPYTYTGIFYNTYTCPEYSTPQIKSKKTKFSCVEEAIGIDRVEKIVDKTKDKEDFACDEALESFYEDEEYIYYYNCIKSKYIVVQYKSGYEETVENALKNKSITIKDLDDYNINYIKYSKIEQKNN